MAWYWIVTLFTFNMATEILNETLPFMNSNASISGYTNMTSRSSSGSSDKLKDMASSISESLSESVDNHPESDIIHNIVKENTVKDGLYTVMTSQVKEKEEEPSTGREDTKQINGDEDDSTLLDLFGEKMKIFFTHHMIPPTDAQCRWNWRFARCEPYCTCSIQYLVGDYHLGRACRFRATNHRQRTYSPSTAHFITRKKKRQKLDLSTTATTADSSSTRRLDYDNTATVSSSDDDDEDDNNDHDHNYNKFIQTCQNPPSNLYTSLFTFIEKSFIRLHHTTTQFIAQYIESINLFYCVQSVRTWFYQLIQDLMGNFL